MGDHVCYHTIENSKAAKLTKCPPATADHVSYFLLNRYKALPRVSLAPLLRLLIQTSVGDAQILHTGAKCARRLACESMSTLIIGPGPFFFFERTDQGPLAGTQHWKQGVQFACGLVGRACRIAVVDMKRLEAVSFHLMLKP